MYKLKQCFCDTLCWLKASSPGNPRRLKPTNKNKRNSALKVSATMIDLFIQKLYWLTSINFYFSYVNFLIYYFILSTQPKIRFYDTHYKHIILCFIIKESILFYNIQQQKGKTMTDNLYSELIDPSNSNDPLKDPKIKNKLIRSLYGFQGFAKQHIDSFN